MQLTVKQWLERIADEKIRENALRQMDVLHDDTVVGSIEDAIVLFAYWYETEEGNEYWLNLHDNPPALLNETKTEE